MTGTQRSRGETPALPPGTSLAPGVLPPGRLLGIDAGGSATRVAVAEGGQVVSWSETTPMNALLTPDVPDRLAELALTAGAAAVGVGLPGIRTEVAGAELAALVGARCGCPVRVVPDAEVARLGAFLGEPGVIVAAGTGSVAVGWDGARTARAGGHGYLFGDDGGAYWIGREAARSVLRWQDGAGGSPALAAAVLDAVGGDADDLVRRAHRHPGDRSLLAGLAPVVTSLAGTDDEAARISREAAGHLAALASTVCRRLGPLPVAGVGGVLAAAPVWGPFAAASGARRPMAPPAVGALLLAARTHEELG